MASTLPRPARRSTLPELNSIDGRRLRIAFVVHDYHRSGGHSRYVAELASRFKRKHEVHIFANRFEEPDPSGIVYHHVPALRVNALATILSFLPAATLLIRGRFDIVHAQGVCGLRQDVVTTHICQSGWSAAATAHLGRGGWRKRIFGRATEFLERLLYRPSRASRFIAVSERVRRDLQHHYGLCEKVCVIHHGIDADTFHPRNRDRWRAAVRAELGLGEAACLALYVGDLQKAGPALVGAIARCPGVKLLIVSRSKLDIYTRMAAKSGVAERLIFAPPSREVERYYAAADIFLFPTFYDSFGMVVTEAMASGLPVITNRAAGAAELIENQVNGLLTSSPWDTEELAAALCRLRDNAGLRQRLGQAARARVEELTWDKVADQTMAVYREILAERNA